MKVMRVRVSLLQVRMTLLLMQMLLLLLQPIPVLRVGLGLQVDPAGVLRGRDRSLRDHHLLVGIRRHRDGGWSTIQ